jgi:cyclopropane fatty-acyl-phospholipid synthase-like methyltransferase
VSQQEVIARVERYYSAKVTQHGATPAGVDWNSSASQTLRFEQLLKVCNTDAPFSLTDFGCGYGALADYLGQRGVRCTYRGYDVSPAMIEEAGRISRLGLAVEFFASPASLRPTTYTVASGIFNRP